MENLLGTMKGGIAQQIPSKEVNSISRCQDLWAIKKEVVKVGKAR